MRKNLYKIKSFRLIFFYNILLFRKIYFTTKSGLSCFTKAVTKDMKHSFRFVEIVPRRIKTNFHQTSKAPNLYNNDYILDVEEVSKVILFVIDNPYITNITVKDPRR